MEIKNIFENVPEECKTEIFEILFEDKGLKLERIISEGQATPPGQWYDLFFERDGAIVVLRAGDYIHIPAHKKHRVEWTDPQEKTIWLAIHFKSGER